MKVQESTYRTRLEEITETANRLQSLGGRYQSQAENARKLVARARLDLEQSKAKMGSVASICVLKNCLVHYYHLPVKCLAKGVRCNVSYVYGARCTPLSNSYQCCSGLPNARGLETERRNYRE